MAIPAIVVNTVVSLLAKRTTDAATNKVKTRISKTKIASAGLLAVGPDWGTLIPGVMAKDPVAIGNLVLILVTYAGTLYGSGNKG